MITFMGMIAKKVNLFYDKFWLFLLYTKIRFGETQL